jgi:adenosine deaminase
MLRDLPPESALKQYEAALSYRGMVAGIGLDSDEYERPPMLFEEMFRRARVDGFKLTSHCDFNQKDTHEHIRQVAESIGGLGADRIDHGTNAADRDALIESIESRGIWMTICPCAYIRHTAEEEVFPRIRKLFDAGIKVTIASDDPAYMEDNWLLHNLLMVQDKCKFTNQEMAQLQRNAISVCWASDHIKQELLNDLDQYENLYR